MEIIKLLYYWKSRYVAVWWYFCIFLLLYLPVRPVEPVLPNDKYTLNFEILGGKTFILGSQS